MNKKGFLSLKNILSIFVVFSFVFGNISCVTSQTKSDFLQPTLFQGNRQPAPLGAPSQLRPNISIKEYTSKEISFEFLILKFSGTRLIYQIKRDRDKMIFSEGWFKKIRNKFTVIMPAKEGFEFNIGEKYVLFLGLNRNDLDKASSTVIRVPEARVGSKGYLPGQKYVPRDAIDIVYTYKFILQEEQLQKNDKF